MTVRYEPLALARARLTDSVSGAEVGLLVGGSPLARTFSLGGAPFLPAEAAAQALAEALRAKGADVDDRDVAMALPRRRARR